MIYLETKDGKKLIVLEPGHISHLMSGQGLQTPEDSIAIYYTPDIVWLGEKIKGMALSGSLTAASLEKALAVSQSRPIVAIRETHPPKVIIADGKVTGH